MVYTDICVGDNNIIFVTNKKHEQKVYYSGENYFGSKILSKNMLDIVEIENFVDNYGYIVNIKYYEDTFVFVTDKGVYICRYTHTCESTNMIIEIPNFYHLYGDIILLGMTAYVICFYTTKGIFFCDTSQGVYLFEIRYFIKYFGVPESLSTDDETFLMKTSKNILEFGSHKFNYDSFKKLLNEEEMRSFEYKFGKILNVNFLYYNNDSSSNLILLLTTENGIYNYNTLSLYHNDCLCLTGHDQKFLFYTKAELYYIKCSTSIPTLNKIKDFCKNYGNIVAVSIGEKIIIIVTTNGVFYSHIVEDVNDYYNLNFSVPNVFFEIPKFFQNYGNIFTNFKKTIKSTSSILC